MWHCASLVLVGTLLAFHVVIMYCGSLADKFEDTILSITAIFAIASRGVLVALMLASLRALPCSAHQTVSWTAYIPHL